MVPTSVTRACIRVLEEGDRVTMPNPSGSHSEKCFHVAVERGKTAHRGSLEAQGVVSLAAVKIIV